MKTIGKLITVNLIGALILIFIGMSLLFAPKSDSLDIIFGTIILIVGASIFVAAINNYINTRIETFGRLLRCAELDIEKYKDQIEELKTNIVSSHQLTDKVLKDLEKLNSEKKDLLDKSRTVCIHCNQPAFF